QVFVKIQRTESAPPSRMVAGATLIQGRAHQAQKAVGISLTRLRWSENMASNIVIHLLLRRGHTADGGSKMLGVKSCEAFQSCCYSCRFSGVTRVARARAPWVPPTPRRALANRRKTLPTWC